MKIERASQAHEHAIEELLDRDRLTNMFLLGLLGTQPLDHACWYVATVGEQVEAVVMILPRLLAVPYAVEPSTCEVLGTFVRDRHTPCLTVGPRADCDALWAAWSPNSEPLRRIDQRLYRCSEVADEPEPARLRAARPDEWMEIAEYARQMEIEDLGRDPAAHDPDLHAKVVKGRIAAGRTLVIEAQGEIGFTVNIGTETSFGCQVGGTFVPPHLRGRGLATRGMRAATRHLLRRHPVVTLHVNEENHPAVRCYEASGYQAGPAFRICTVHEQAEPS